MFNQRIWHHETYFQIINNNILLETYIWRIICSIVLFEKPNWQSWSVWEKLVEMSIQSNKHLAPELCIESIDDILYSIGLSHDSVRDRPKRSVINKPIFIAIVLLLQIPLRIVSNSTHNETLYLLTADCGHYLSIKQHVNVMSILVSLMALFSQMVYYHNHSIGVKPTFVRLFQVLFSKCTWNTP